MATITMNGQEMVLAFGGMDTRTRTDLNSVEQFDTGNNTWTLAPTSMVEARSDFDALAVPRELVCLN